MEDNPTPVMILLGIVILVTSLVVLAFLYPPSCVERKIPVRFVSAVGHRTNTGYLYELEDGILHEFPSPVKTGELICVSEKPTWRWAKVEGSL